MNRFLTEACSPTEKYGCSESQTKPAQKISTHGSAEAMGHYLTQWQSSWDAMGGATGSSSR